MANEQNHEQLIGVTMFARLLGRSEDTIRDLERRGIIAAVRDSANRRQFTADQIQRAMRHYRKEIAA